MQSPSSIWRASGKQESFKDFLKKFNASGDMVDEIIIIETDSQVDDTIDQSGDSAFSDYAPNGFDDGNDLPVTDDMNGFVYQPMENNISNVFNTHQCITYGLAGLIAGIVTVLIINDLKKQ